MIKILLLTFFLIKINAICPNGSLNWQNECYSFNSTATGFADAESQCINNAGHLTSIHDGFTNAWITQEASNYFQESTVTNFWIGLTDLIHPGNWSWTDGSSTNFTDISSISNLTGSDCISVSLTNGRWQAEDCFKTKAFVCKSAKPVFPAFVNCTPPLIYFQPTHSCYGDGTQRNIKNWALSEDYCISVGGHLASIHSHAELIFLDSLSMIAASNFWVGASSNDEGVTWKWSDETPWDYNPWVSGYPNRTTSGCGIHWGVGIRDVNCSEARTLICQIKL